MNVQKPIGSPHIHIRLSAAPFQNNMCRILILAFKMRLEIARKTDGLDFAVAVLVEIALLAVSSCATESQIRNHGQRFSHMMINLIRCHRRLDDKSQVQRVQ
jgi:hypothetical protein